MTTIVCALLAVLAVATVLFLGGCSSSKPQRVSMGTTFEGGYTCPLTGEQLPCPKCCPLNKQQ